MKSLYVSCVIVAAFTATAFRFQPPPTPVQWVAHQHSFLLRSLSGPRQQLSGNSNFVATRLFASLNDNGEKPEIDELNAPKLDYDECYYSVLEVSPSISPEALKKAYYKIVFRFHPDNKHSEQEKALSNRQMMVINGAYRVLKDAERRQQYDVQRKHGLIGAKAGVKGSGRNDPTERSRKKARKPARSMWVEDADGYHDFSTAAKNAANERSEANRKEFKANYPPKTPSNTQSAAAARFWAKYGYAATSSERSTDNTYGTSSSRRSSSSSNDRSDYDRYKDEFDFGTPGASSSGSNATPRKPSSASGSAYDTSQFMLDEERDFLTRQRVRNRGDGSIKSLKVSRLFDEQTLPRPHLLIFNDGRCHRRT